MPEPSSVVIVGGGLAGAKTAEALREQGSTGRSRSFRPRTSCPTNARRCPRTTWPARPSSTMPSCIPPTGTARTTSSCASATTVAASIAVRTRVELADGRQLSYGKLVLATGSDRAACRSPAPTPRLTLRTREDSDAIRATFGAGKRLVIVGAGWIGLEVAAAAREADTEVTVIEAAELPLLGRARPEIAQVFADLHREHGVRSAPRRPLDRSR